MAQDITLKLSQDEKRALKFQLMGFQKSIGEILKKPTEDPKAIDYLREVEKLNNSILRKIL